MADKTKIEWTDATWNPIRGCSRVSEGCRNCYAERVAARFSGPGQPYHGLAKRIPIYERLGNDDLNSLKIEARWTGEVRLIESVLDAPLHWKRPRKIFVNSMSDLFHEKVDDQWIKKIFGVMARCEQHTFQILTKRADRMQRWMSDRFEQGGRLDLCAPLNVWLCVSVEDKKTADERIPLLLQTPAAVRGVSYEPALGPVDFAEWLPRRLNKTCFRCNREFDRVPERADHEAKCSEPIKPEPQFLDWIVCGGESGAGARPMHPDWARAVRDQCQAAGVPFFFKQWGEWMPFEITDTNTRYHNPSAFEHQVMYSRRHMWDPRIGSLRAGKKRAGRLLDGREWNEFPPGVGSTWSTPREKTTT